MDETRPISRTASSPSVPIPSSGARTENGPPTSGFSLASKGRRTSSWVWKYFHKTKLQGKLVAKCKKCNATYSVHGTTNLSRHVKKFCLPIDKVDDESEVVNIEIDQHVFREKVAMAIIRHLLPFSFVEYEEIRKVFKYLNSSVEDVSRNTIKADVVNIYEIEKAKLKKELECIKSRICLTSDLWSSLTSDGYMCLTAHYVDNNWLLQKRILIFRHIPPPHDSQSIGEKLIIFLREWGIEKKIFTLTLDNASYNQGVVGLLRNHLRLTNSLVSRGEFLHVRCGAHILNLIVQDGLKVVCVAVGKIRETVKYLRGSEIRIMKFVECVKQLGIKMTKSLKQDMPIRWNSTYLMLESALLYKLAFCELELVDKNYKWCPTAQDWFRVEKIAKFLRPFFEITELLSGSKYPTSNLYFLNVWKIQVLIQEEMMSEDIAIREMARGMKPKFDKYWDSYSSILSFALVLDPRFKFQFVEYAFSKVDAETSKRKVSELRFQMQDLFEEYLFATTPLTPAHSSSTNEINNEIGDELMDEFDAIESEGDRSESQLEKYLAEPKLDRKKFDKLDLLEYWSANSSRYPELAQMAREILSIPITTVASESAFSLGGRIIGKYRSSIDPGNVEAILCGRDWLEVDYSEDEVCEILCTDMEKMAV